MVLRGSGGNFGIVTSFECRLHVGLRVMFAAMMYPMELARELLPNWGEIHLYWKSLRLDRLDEEVIAAIADHAANRPSPRTLVPIWHYGGAMSRVGPEETAFGDSRARYLLSLDSTWEAPADTEENVAWTRNAWNDMQRFSIRGSYLNFMGDEGKRLVHDA